MRRALSVPVPSAQSHKFFGSVPAGSGWRPPSRTTGGDTTWRWRLGPLGDPLFPVLGPFPESAGLPEGVVVRIPAVELRGGRLIGMVVGHGILRGVIALSLDATPILAARPSRPVARCGTARTVPRIACRAGRTSRWCGPTLRFRWDRKGLGTCRAGLPTRSTGEGAAQ